MHAILHGGGNRIYGRHMIIQYITDSLQNAKSLKIFKDSVVQGQRQGLVNWSWKILEDKDFPRGLQQWVALAPVIENDIRQPNVVRLDVQPFHSVEITRGPL